MKSKNLQKVLAIFLALGMLISYLPISASAQAAPLEGAIIEGNGIQPYSIPAFTGELEKSSEPKTIGPAPRTESAGQAELILNENAVKYGITAAPPAYGVEVYPSEQLYQWPDASVPGTKTVVGTPSATSLFAGDFMGDDFSTLYVGSYDDNGLYAVDTTNAQSTKIGTMTLPTGTLSGLAGGPDVMYGVSTECNVASTLVSVNLQTAAVTTIGTLPVSTCLIDLTYVPDNGMLYGVDLVTASLHEINPEDGVDTIVGALGVAPNYAQGMDYDEVNKVLYWASYTDVSALRIIDINTGASTEVGSFGLNEVDAFSIAAFVPLGDYELTGTVTDSVTSAPLSGATVTATPTEGNPKTATTDADGVYTIALDAGTYSVTAAKLGYTPKTETVTVPEDAEEPVVQNFALVQLPATLLTGTVKDGGITGTTDKHGYSLYAKLSFTALGVTEVAYTNPFTGAYSISLVQNTDYTVKVESLTTDYLPLTESFTTVGNSQSKNFELLVPASACSTAGYGVSGTVVDFDNLQLPAGWTNFDYAGTGQVWQFNDPAGRGNLTAGSGGYATLDSDNYGYGGTQDAGLRTPVLNFSGTSAVVLEFDSYYYTYSGQTGMVRYSIDGGTTWINKQTLPATTQGLHYNIDLTTELAGQTQAMVEFKFQANWGYYWQIDNVSLGDPLCEIIDGGVVAGYVFDANEDEVKLVDAKVETALASDTTTASVDPSGNGLYWLFQPTTFDIQEVEFTISKSKYVTLVEYADVEQDEINHFDFELGAGHLVADPPAVEVTMDLGEADKTETLVLENDGSATATWSMTEKAGGFTPMKVSIPAFTGTLPQSDVPTSMFRDPNAKSTGKPGLVLNSNAAIFGITEVVPAFGIDLDGDALYSWENVGAPAAYELVGTPGGSATSLFAGDFMSGDFETLYVVSYDNNKLFAVDTSDASATEIGTTTPASGYTFGGLAGTPDVMYGMASICNTGSKLYTIDLDNATTEFVGDVNGPNCIIDITYVPEDGMLYGVDLVTNSFYRIDPATANTTLVGATGADPNYAQGMDYDEENNIMYWAAYTTQAELRVIDMTTGASTLIGAFTGLTEVDAFSVAAGGAPIDRIPWLSEDILEGQILEGEVEEIELTFTVANIGQPGIYEGSLVVKDDSPYADLLIPVTLNVTRPADFGSFKGFVYALEQCDVEPAPAEKATVIFYQNGAEKARTQVDENGYFSYALLEGTYDIEIELDGYVSQMIEDLELVGGEDFTLDDVNLRLDAPCLIVDPDALYQEQYTGEIYSQTVTFTNIGAKETVFELTEKDMGGPTPFRADEVNLILDDGSYDNALGVGGTADFIAVNRFSPTADQFPMTLTEVSLYFEGSTVASGQPFKVVIYQNTSGNSDPAVGSDLLHQQTATVGSVPGWTVVTLDQPVVLDGPGDVLVGSVFTHKPGAAYFPASMDQTASQGRSWVGYWLAADAPAVPTLPPDDAWATVDSVGFAGNWMIRAKGTTGGGGGGGTGGDILWLDIDVMADVVMPGDSVEVTFTFDSNGLLWGDYFGNVSVKNQPDPTFDIPVQLRVIDWEWQFLPLINMKWPLPAGK